ncbi:hypothetical protein PybrP1_002705 [[Pythium] brassicae (nom. inval.)]|nr:hypothetical protein PybrP1_002705 [[Pythium] brassicae (nom. inval.)]
MHSLLALCVAASAALVHSSRLSGGPVTDLPPNAALNSQHPAVGEDLSPDSPGLRLVEAREAANDTDLKRLEDYFGFGRHPDPRYRDLGAGFFHLAVTNILGKLRKAFIVDVAAGREVWNQPVRSYQVLEETPMTLEQGALTHFGVNTYPFNAAATSLVYVVTRFSWVTEALEDGPLQLAQDLSRYTKSADYSYLLELNDDDEIIGGEWVDRSLSEHPDFMWLPQRTPSPDTVSRAGVSYTNVQQLLKASVNGDCMDVPGPGTVSAPDL